MQEMTIFSLLRFIRGLQSRWRNIYYRALGVKLHGYIWLQNIEIPRNFHEIEIEKSCALDNGVVLLCSGTYQAKPKIYIGAYTYINRNTILDAIDTLHIGSHCAIGPGCYITDHDHGHDPSQPPLHQPMIAKPTTIGDQVWIGANVTILKGVTIGEGCVIGAGSVVTRSFPAEVIIAGVPARVIKQNQRL